MVSEHDDDGGLLIGGEVVHQLFEILVGLVGQGQVLLRPGVLAGAVGEGHFGGVVRLLIAAVVLIGDVEEEQGLPGLLVLKLPDDLLEVGVVAGVGVLDELGHIQVLAELHLVEPQQRIGLIPVPGLHLSGVEGQGAIAQIPQQGSHGGGLLGDVLLIGGAARGQEGHGVACEELKLTGAGASAEHGGIGVAKDGIVQGLDVVHDALAERQVAVALKVRPGLVHNGDDVVLLPGLGAALLVGGALYVEGQPLPLGVLHLAEDVLHVVNGGVGGLLHFHVLGVVKKGAEGSVGAVAHHLLPGVGSHLHLLQHGGLGKDEHQAQASHHPRHTGHNGLSCGPELAPG